MNFTLWKWRWRWIFILLNLFQNIAFHMMLICLLYAQFSFLIYVSFPSADWRFCFFFFFVLHTSHRRMQTCCRISLICFSHPPHFLSLASKTVSWNISVVTNIYGFDDSSPTTAHTHTFCGTICTPTYRSIVRKSSWLCSIHAAIWMKNKAHETWFYYSFILYSIIQSSCGCDFLIK